MVTGPAKTECAELPAASSTAEVGLEKQCAAAPAISPKDVAPAISPKDVAPAISPKAVKRDGTNRAGRDARGQRAAEECYILVGKAGDASQRSDFDTGRSGNTARRRRPRSANSRCDAGPEGAQVRCGGAEKHL
jgi:hypothetical protein